MFKIKVNDPEAVLDEKAVEKLNRLSRPWTLQILILLDKDKPMRFNSIKKVLSGICSRSLSERLDEMETDGIIKRVVTDDSPPKVEYFLTDKGQELKEIAIEILNWVRKWE